MDRPEIEITQLCRFPVKGLSAETLNTLDLIAG